MREQVRGEDAAEISLETHERGLSEAGGQVSALRQRFQLRHTKSKATVPRGIHRPVAIVYVTLRLAADTFRKLPPLSDRMPESLRRVEDTAGRSRDPHEGTVQSGAYQLPV